MPVPQDALVLRGLGAHKPAPSERFGFCFVVSDASGARKLLTVERRKSGIHVAHAIEGGVQRSYAADGATHARTGAMKIDSRQLQPLGSFSGLVLFQQGTSSLEPAALASCPALGSDDEFDQIVQLDARRLRSRRVRHDVWLVEPFRHGQIPIQADRALHFTLATHTSPWIVVVLTEEPTSARKGKKSSGA